MRGVVLFDLDDTLVVEEPAAVASFEAVARRAAAECDDSLSRDVAGATAARIRAVWINRDGRDRPAGHDRVREIATLADLPAVLAGPAA